MTVQSINEVVRQAAERTGAERVRLERRTRLLSDRGPGYVARAFKDYLRMLAMRHIYCSPHHPQTNGNLECFHEALSPDFHL